MKYVSCALGLFALAASAPASAAIILTTYTVKATFVTPRGLVPLPFTNVTGSYTLAYNTAVTNQNSAITLAAFNLAFNGVHFDTGNTGKQFLFPTTNPKTLQIGGLLNGAGGIAQNTNDFRFTFAYLPDYTNISPLKGAFPAPEFIVAVQGRSGIRSGTNLQVKAIPEPITWAMMLAGFGLVGAALRVLRRRPVSVA